MEETAHTTAPAAAGAPHTPDGDPPASEAAREEALSSEETTTSPSGGDADGRAVASDSPGFSERGRMRRRMRFLRKARELAYRDLGGLVFDLHRFGRRNDALVLAKLETIGRIDTELRALEAALAEHRPVTVLREAGVAACPRCAAIHGSDDRFCPNCGLAMDLRAERPVAGPQSAAQAPVRAPAPTAPAPMPVSTPAVAQAMPPTAVHALAPATPVPDRAAPTAPDPSTTAPTPAAPGRGPAPAPMPSTAAPAPVPAPAAPGRSPVAPARRTTSPSGPAPTIGDGDPGVAEDRPNVDQPTEIVRPPAQSP